MSDKPGKFTQQFDAEIFNKKLEAHEGNEKEKEQNQKLQQIQERLDKRKTFLMDRFNNITDNEPDAGISLVFEKTADYSQHARLEFTREFNEETGAVFLRYHLEVGGESPKQDYITISLKKFDLKKIENFIEAKILQFARSYVQGS